MTARFSASPTAGTSMTRSSVLFVAVSLVAGVGGTAMTLAAAIWVMTLTGSSALAARASFFVFAPTLLGPVLGALVDLAAADESINLAETNLLRQITKSLGLSQQDYLDAQQHHRQHLDSLKR